MNNLTIEEQKVRAKASVAKMQIEEFGIAIGQIKRIGVCLLMFAAVLLISTLLFGAWDWPFIIISVITGLIVLQIRDMVDWNNSTNIILAIGIFIGITILELLLFGLPYPFLANLEYGPRIVIIINALTPFLYPGLKLILAFPFFSMLNHKNKLAAHPIEVFDYLKANNKIPKSLQHLMPK